MKKRFVLLTIFTFSCLSAPQTVLADDEFALDPPSSDQPAEKTPEYQPITSIDALTMGKGGANSLSRAAEYCLHNQQFDKAIKLSKMALDQNYDDNEIHQIYAEALEGKLKG